VVVSFENRHKAFQDVVETAGIPPFFYRIFPPVKFPITTHIRLLELGYKNAELADLPPKFLDNETRLRSEAPRWGVLQYMLNGRMKFIDCGTEWWVEPGEAVLFTIPSRTSYYDSTDPDAKWFFLTFSGTTAMAIADELIRTNGCILRGLEHSRFVPMAAQMFSMVTAHTPTPVFEFSADLYHILMELSAQVFSYRQNYPEPVAYALELMDREFGNADFSLEKLAALVCLSKYYFSRMFKEHVGENPGAYLQSKRMQTAMDLLLHSNKPIKEIQYLCGFKKYNYFLTSFRKAYGVSPGNVRAK
jgi:AraC-like DNA-binding protein